MLLYAVIPTSNSTNFLRKCNLKTNKMCRCYLNIAHVGGHVHRYGTVVPNMREFLQKRGPKMRTSQQGLFLIHSWSTRVCAPWKTVYWASLFLFLSCVSIQENYELRKRLDDYERLEVTKKEPSAGMIMIPLTLTLLNLFVFSETTATR